MCGSKLAVILAALRTTEANLYDLALFGSGNRYSLEEMWPELRQTRLTDRTWFATPIFFVLGRHDQQVPSSVAAEYFSTIHAPCKRLEWFENSAHNPPFEEPARFERIVGEELLPLAR